MADSEDDVDAQGEDEVPELAEGEDGEAAALAVQAFSDFSGLGV